MKVIRWYPDTAARFIELLRDHTWNDSVRMLKIELLKDKRS